MRGKILIIDDDRSMCQMLEAGLSKRDFEVSWENSADEAFELFMSESFNAVLTDLNLPGIDGIELCHKMSENQPNVPVIVITSFGNYDTAVAALRAGAYDFISKPIDIEPLVLVLDRAVKHHELLGQIKRLSEAAEVAGKYENIIGSSPAMTRVFDIMKRVSKLDSSVLITGESGTGKELVSRALHRQGSRKSGPFIAVNCTAMPETLLESELFGHKGGAFTGAQKAHDGLFVQASGGTLFLDEIGDMPLELQPKILRAIEQRTVRPVGGDKEVSFDVRIIAATNHDLESAVEQKKFREDLYYRLNVIKIELPPLRSRQNDVILLAQNFIEQFAEATGKKVHGLCVPAAEKLKDYSWPGNVRELRNYIESAVALTDHEKILVEDLPEKIRAYKKSELRLDAEDPERLHSMEEVERRYIEHVLKATGGNKTNAAQILGFDRKTLYRKLEKYKISDEEL